jgi:hypothetical protein
LTNDAVFATGASYQVVAVADTGSSAAAVTAPTVKQTDGSHFDLRQNNASSASIRWIALGT